MSRKKGRSAWKNLAGITGLLLAGYVIVTALPDIRRYARMVSM